MSEFQGVWVVAELATDGNLSETSQEFVYYTVATCLRCIGVDDACRPDYDNRAENACTLFLDKDQSYRYTWDCGLNWCDPPSPGKGNVQAVIDPIVCPKWIDQKEYTPIACNK